MPERYSCRSASAQTPPLCGLCHRLSICRSWLRTKNPDHVAKLINKPVDMICRNPDDRVTVARIILRDHKLASCFIDICGSHLDRLQNYLASRPIESLSL